MLILLMTSNGNWYMHFFSRKKDIEITDFTLVSIQTHKTMPLLEHRTKKKIFEIESIQKEIQDHSIATLKRGGERSWIKQQIFQLNTMQQNWKRSYSNYTQPVHHITIGEPISKHLMQQETNQNKKRVGSPPNQIHIIQKKKEEKEEKTETEQYRRSQSTQKHRKTHTWGGVQSEQHIQNAQIL